MTIGPLIEAVDLAGHLDDRAWVTMDCRFNLLQTDAGHEAYLRSHIPGARYAHLNRDLARAPRPDEGRHPLPPPALFAARLGDWGIDNRSIVVVYDEGGGAIAARLWWMLRWVGHEDAAVLNGGFSAWQRAELPLQRQLPTWPPARYVAGRTRADWVVDAAQILALQSGGGIVVDARAAARYRGAQEPIDPVAGHIPGAYNWPFSQSLAEDGRFRDPDELKPALLTLFGGRDPKQVIAMCGSGVTACHLLLAMQVAGLAGGRLFAGSWSEWIRDPARPIRTGDQP